MAWSKYSSPCLSAASAGSAGCWASRGKPMSRAASGIQDRFAAFMETSIHQAMRGIQGRNVTPRLHCRPGAGNLRRRRQLVGRKLYPEGAAGPDFALHPDRSAMGLDGQLAKGEAESARSHCRGLPAGLAELLEDLFVVLLRNPAAPVAHPDPGA